MLKGRSGDGPPAAEPAVKAARPMMAVPTTGRHAPEIVAGNRAIAGRVVAKGLFQGLGRSLPTSRTPSRRRVRRAGAGYIDADLGTDPLHSMIIGAIEALDLAYVGVGL
jgi:hypothetical protein